MMNALRSGDALIIVDVQNDFLPGGAMPVSGGEEIVPVLNRYLTRFADRTLPVFATRDWHPENHCSFREQAGRWPAHAVAHSRGAEFPADLILPARATTIAKGTDPAREASSAFDGTTLAAQLHAAGIHRLFVGGLATESGVLHTVRDALEHGFRVHLLTDAIRAVNLFDHDGLDAVAEMKRLGAIPATLMDLETPNPGASALLLDGAQLMLARAHLAAGLNDTAVFELFVRRLPARWNFMVSAGLEQALDFLETFHFTVSDRAWLEEVGGFDPSMARRLGELRFTGDVHAMPEGTVFFPDEPWLRVTAPMAEALLVGTRLVKLLHFQTLMASKAVRSVLVAPGKVLIDGGSGYAQGAEAALLAARACVIAGFHATTNVLAAAHYGITLAGTTATVSVAGWEQGEADFIRLIHATPDVMVLLDTNDVEAAAHKVVELAPMLQEEGGAIKGVRLTGGDFAVHAGRVRRILDAGGLVQTKIYAGGQGDEDDLLRQLEEGAPIDGFESGALGAASADASSLDAVYQLQDYGGQPRWGWAEGKASWPGAKQVYRHVDLGGKMKVDHVARATESAPGVPLLECVMRHGRRTGAAPPLREIADRTRRQVAQLPEALRTLESSDRHPVMVSPELHALARHAGLIPLQGGSGACNAPSALHHAGLAGHLYTDAGPPPEDGPVDEGTAQ